MSSRTRVLVTVAVAAVAAAAVAIGATLATRTHPPKQQAAQVLLKPRQGTPPLVLDLGLREDGTARAIERASRLYQAGKRAQAAAIFSRYADLNAQVGAALAGWPTGTLERLQALARSHPDSSVVRLNLGLADFWAGKGPEALAAWRDAVQADP